ncbi:sigma-54-dependent Fis family transcriptional regulator [Oceanidesulfovibrio indonesiensis]|uniref:Sigma-54-dependent Fis family transcriptional regulator n=1 Tax=Oceanidesulfovibrio indonesiensis TaxID=54767 RepID=A0A7M3MJU9_9BACT|nr:sigma-54 dependent transcriptional regulator [Oceanidesulfovibrio indonesiensis]TVM19711.1 sigma-54-dependent Fis family transcriptional regulator [Oceanidesulfovibrio indonesiensis]
MAASAQTILFLAPPTAVTTVFSLLKEEGFEVGLAENLKGALGFIRKSRPLVVFSRPSMSGYRVEDLLAEAEKDKDFPPVIVFTEQGSAQEAQGFLEKGAKDYWLEPLDAEKILAAVPAHPPQGRITDTPQDVMDKYSIIGTHPAITRILALAKQVAKSKATVLIQGESGTGKEMIARYLHQMSDRANAPFVAVNCAALPEHLLESELFGHEKGAFTGAVSRKLGKFELANHGTLLLDEISEMDLGLQAKLLRVLQEGELDRVGGMETVKVDVRVLATTNRELQQWVEQGKFRQDLYFRLNVIPLTLPPLHDRGDDILRLARHFVEQFRHQYQLPPLAFSAEAEKWLVSYDWPGNVRELQNLMERSVLLAGAGPISTEHFLLDDTWTPPEEATSEPAVPQASGETQAAAERESAEHHAPAPLSGEGAEHMLGDTVLPISEMERIMIMRGLKQTSGNRTQAAEMLGISVRTLRNKLNEYRSRGLDVP